MDPEKLEKANQLSEKIIDLKKELDNSNNFENLLAEKKNREPESIVLKCTWSGWPTVQIKKEVAEVAISLTTKKLEKELMNTEEEFKNL